MNVIHTSRTACSVLLAALITFPIVGAAQTSSAGGTILKAAEASKLLPDAVFYAGKSATTQLRNSAGVRFADGKSILAVLVDTSGYSTAIQQKYQGYLLSETPVFIGGHALAPGAYGIGFVGDRFVVTDIGSHDLVQTSAAHDAQMQRPMPLQVLAGSSPGAWRLCLGRDCVDFRAK